MWRSVFSCSAPVNTVCSHVLALPPVNTVWLPLGLKSTTPWMPRLPRPLPPKRAMSVSTPDLETAHGPRVVILRESMDDFVRRFCKGPRTKDIKSHTVCRNRLCSFRNFSYFPCPNQFLNLAVDVAHLCLQARRAFFKKARQLLLYFNNCQYRVHGTLLIYAFTILLTRQHC